MTGFKSVVVQGICREHQLACKSEIVERFNAVVVAKRTQRMVPSTSHNFCFGVSHVVGVVVQANYLVDPGGVFVTYVGFKLCLSVLTHIFSNGGWHFHHVRVGVVDGLVLYIGHVQISFTYSCLRMNKYVMNLSVGTVLYRP